MGLDNERITKKCYRLRIQSYGITGITRTEIHVLRIHSYGCTGTLQAPVWINFKRHLTDDYSFNNLGIVKILKAR